MNLTIRTKLLVGFAIILVLFISAALLITAAFSETNDRLGKFVNVSGKRINLSNEILIAVLNASRYEKNVILENDALRKESFRQEMTRYMEVVDQKLPELRSLSDDTEKVIIDELITSWAMYHELTDEIVRFSMNNQSDSAFALSGSEGRRFRDKTIAQIEKLIGKNNESIQRDKADSDQSYSASLTLITLFLVAGLLIAVLISYWIISSTRKRISFIASEAEKISSREHMDAVLNDPIRDELQPIFLSLVNISNSFREIAENANQVASGNYTVDLVPRSNKDTLGLSLKKMTGSLRETTAENERHNWLATGQNQLNEHLRGDQDTAELAQNTITFLANYTQSHVGALYAFNEEASVFDLTGQYAFASGAQGVKKIIPGEGLIGQAAREQKLIVLDNLREEDIRITSSLLDTKPAHLVIAPFTFENKTLGVFELGKLTAFDEKELEFIRTSTENVGISFNSAIARKKIQLLLEKTQVQSEELQSQQEELRQINEELEEQAQNLKQQQEELQVTNEELEEQTQSLEMKNKEVEAARTDIEQKTKQLEISSRYKSEFLANMSHELRTPLNSLLILSKDLADNRKGNLSDEQVESAEIINKSGHDLLGLINEVLDLSKIESGKMTLSVERIPIASFVNDLRRNFKHQADQKGIRLEIRLENSLPEAIRTDVRRFDQVIRNLMSNAIKFTDKGAVTVMIRRRNEKNIAIEVHDTGIGIPADKQALIFEAFQQVDGSTSRKYGGTGLGLSISRELTRLLQGEITVASKINEGSVFTLILPIDIDVEASLQAEEGETVAAPMQPSTTNTHFLNYPSTPDDRENITRDDKIVLIIEDDLKFAPILMKQAHAKGFKCLHAATGEDGLVLVGEYKPQAVLLDLDLPGIDGHRVLAEIKANPETRHIPVHVISVNERNMNLIKEGAIEYLTKPIDKKQMEEAFNRIENFIERKMKNLLVIEDDENSRKVIKKLIGNGDVKCIEAGTGKDALELFKNNHIDCIVLDLGLPDMSGFELIYQLERQKEGQMPPIIVYTGRELSKTENAELQKYAETIIIKGVKSEERLLDETALFLHRTIGQLPESQQKMIAGLYDKASIYHGKKILVVDDDMRNVFALSKILKERGMSIEKAENGVIALRMVEQQPDIDMVLMDIMMPEMDGYEAMRRIRAQQKFRDLPIIALTAKAMKEDKQKCIDAGANDYIAKPVDIERLLSLMRVWLSK
ncbi:MAG TPA: response regulator [Bacteroidia bacterium]|nr:response regulator [Bacteroidia bacterium]